MIAAMSSDLHVVRAGQGPRVLFIHGSAADHTTWSIQLSSSLRERFELVAYDRPGDLPNVEAHASAAAALVDAEHPAIVVGSSFGAVIALELLRTYPDVVRGAVLIEPPMAASDDLVPVPAALLAELDRRIEQEGGPAAGMVFLRTVLGDAAFERMPLTYRDRAASRWREIRADTVALIDYKPRFAELATVDVPVLLLGGQRSATYFRATLDALLRALPRARLEIVSGGGHMLHAEAHRTFAELLTEFAAQLQIE